MRIQRWQIYLLVVSIVTLAGCTMPLIRPEGAPATGEIATVAPAADQATTADEAVAAAALQQLADQLGVAVADVTVAAVEAAEWPDSCLGLAGSDEMCAAVIVPGFQVTLNAGGQEYVFRTNHDGSQSRLATPAE